MNKPLAVQEPVSPDLSDLPVRFSHLRAYGRSAMHGYHARTTEMAQTSAMQKGTAVHALILGGRKIMGYPGAVRRGKEYDAFVAENPDAEILTMSDYDKANRMADAVRANQLAMPVLSGYCETRLNFEWNGLQCRATPDVRGLDYLTELKTCSNSDPNKFLWHALRMAYPAQLWFQHIGCELNGFSIQRHYIVAVESAEPYPVTVFEIQPRALDQAAKTLALWAERLKTCEQSGMWPPYAQSVVPLDVPDDEMPQLVYGDEEKDAA